MTRGFGLLSLVAAAGMAACGQSERFQTIAAGTVGHTRVIVSAPAGIIQQGDNLIRVEFRDAGDQPLDVEGTAITLRAPAMGSTLSQMRDVSMARRGVGFYEGRTSLTRPGPWEGLVQWQENGAPQHWSFAATSP